MVGLGEAILERSEKHDYSGLNIYWECQKVTGQKRFLVDTWKMEKTTTVTVWRIYKWCGTQNLEKECTLK